MGKDSYKDTDYYGLCILHQGALGVKDEVFPLSSPALNLPQPPVKPNIQLSRNDREKWSSFHLPSYPTTTQPAQERDKDKCTHKQAARLGNSSPWGCCRNSGSPGRPKPIPLSFLDKEYECHGHYHGQTLGLNWR